MDLERAWFAARAAVAGRRRNSHAAAAVDVLAAVPLISATSLAAGLGIAVKNAIRLLDGLVRRRRRRRGHAPVEAATVRAQSHGTAGAKRCGRPTGRNRDAGGAGRRSWRPTTTSLAPRRRSRR